MIIPFEKYALIQVAGAEHTVAVNPATHEIGDTFTLEREPDNFYDRNAVKIMKGNKHFGYIPRTFSKEVSPLLNEGNKYKCVCVSKYNNNPYSMEVAFELEGLPEYLLAK